MKTYYEKISDKILPKFSETCKNGKCKHPLCECRHCSRNYHIGKKNECTKLNLDLTACNCKKFTSPPQLPFRR